ncbi:hypothetical protein P7C71_g768, partial [Lecanoromycetidae sp. Uapishka_2]
MPDIDSIRFSSGAGRSESQHSPSPRASTSSLAAAATINAGIQHEDSRRSSINSNRGPFSPQSGHGERRRYALDSHDPALPGPGELQPSDYSSMNLPYRSRSPMRDPGSPTIPGRGSLNLRDRATSLGALHQELEEEEEGRVNYLMRQIRDLQAQVDASQSQPQSSNTAIDGTTPPVERSYYYSSPGGYQPPPDLHPHFASIMPPVSRPDSPIPQSSSELSRQSSHRSRPVSSTRSPSLRPISAGHTHEEGWSGGSFSRLDDIGHYQAETLNLMRENQMLRQRIRELERQLSEVNQDR